MTTNRRRLIQGMGVSAGALALPGCNQPSEQTAEAATAAASPPGNIDPLDLDAVAQAELIRAGQISPLEVLDATIERIERLDPILNAVVAADFEGARDLARQQTEALANGGKPEGVLYGVPYLVKDLAEVAGLPMDRGSRMFQGTIADQDDPTVVPLRAAGMNIFGKTATPEFGLIGSTETVLHGPCKNPWSLEHSPGGSSGGAGAVVAAGMVPVASGSDGGGSIRIPASNCGVFGLKPSMGSPRGSTPSLPGGIAVRMSLSRTVRDSALLMSLYENPSPTAAGYVQAPLTERLKIGLIIDNHFGEAPHPDVAASIQATAELLRGLGHEVAEHKFMIDGHQMMDEFMAIWTQGPQMARDMLVDQGRDPAQFLEPWTMGLAAIADAKGQAAVPNAIQWLTQATANPAIFGDFDVLLSPVLKTPAAKTGEQSPIADFDVMYPEVLEYVSYTPLANVAGYAAMSVPLGFSQEKLPIGSHFMAPRGQDALLLALAYELEKAQPWKDEWAPHSARNV